MTASYRDIIAGTLPANTTQQQGALESQQARAIERSHWLIQPVTMEILQSLSSMRHDAEQSAKAFALSGSNAECAIKMVEVAMVDKITTILKNV